MLAGRVYLSPLREEKNPSFKVEQAGIIRPTIYDLFTKFTLLFTIQTPLAEIYQSNLAGSI